ncbi:MAG: hypothetical protein KGD60_05410 [Candidatus Thorarchaeota archaeon]|nr:hypothetical protein [Candidatus Thorarchaeota archaeon]
MASYCVMVKGPCRGSFCDFWGRVKIRKSSVEELAAELRTVVVKCQGEDSMTLEDAVREYWRVIGVRDMKKLCEEEPDLCAKMTEAEIQAQI